jgi:type VI secretion system protein ImpH
MNTEAPIEDPSSYGFYALVRALQALHPEMPMVGESSRVSEDIVRFSQVPAMWMEPSEVRAMSKVPVGSDGAAPYLLEEVFFGVFGPRGGLPLHVSEMAIRQEAHDRSAAVTDFVNLFQSRLIALLYRAWQRGQITVSRDRDTASPYNVWLRSLIGLGDEEERAADALPDDIKRYLAGWFATAPGSAQGLAAVASTVIGAPVFVEEFVGEWVPLEAADATRLGGSNARLGEETVIGLRVYLNDSRVTLRTAPLDLELYRSLLPEQRKHNELRDAVKLFLGIDMAFDFQLVLSQSETPRLRLDGAIALGWDSWFTDETVFRDRDDLRLQCR